MEKLTRYTTFENLKSDSFNKKPLQKVVFANKAASDELQTFTKAIHRKISRKAKK